MTTGGYKFEQLNRKQNSIRGIYGGRIERPAAGSV